MSIRIAIFGQRLECPPIRIMSNELEASSLTPIRPIGERIRAWKEVTGKVTSFYNFDVAENYHLYVAAFSPAQLLLGYPSRGGNRLKRSFCSSLSEP
jgi:hypothetical protein